MREFADKTAVITGGASGIGFALAQLCSERRMNIVLADIEERAVMAATNRMLKQEIEAAREPTHSGGGLAGLPHAPLDRDMHRTAVASKMFVCLCVFPLVSFIF